MSAPEVVVVPTGTANLASVRAALDRLGARARLAENAAMIEDATHVVLPGVGSFGAAMAGLREAAFDAALAARVEGPAGRRSPCASACRCCSRRATRAPMPPALPCSRAGSSGFPTGARAAVRLEPGRAGPGCRLIEPGYAYFANSYRVLEAPGCAIATAEHGGRFVAALEQGRVLACQFHPELSGAYGQELIARWLEA